jgi:hypothetical protein
MNDGPSSQRRTKQELKGKAAADAAIERSKQMRPKIKLPRPPKAKPKKIK